MSAIEEMRRAIQSHFANLLARATQGPIDQAGQQAAEKIPAARSVPLGGQCEARPNGNGQAKAAPQSQIGDDIRDVVTYLRRKLQETNAAYQAVASQLVQTTAVLDRAGRTLFEALEGQPELEQPGPIWDRAAACIRRLHESRVLVNTSLQIQVVAPQGGDATEIAEAVADRLAAALDECSAGE